MKYNFDLVYDRASANAEKYTQCKSLFGRDDIIPMWVADMDIASPPFVMEAIKKRAEHPVLGYEDRPVAGVAAQIAWLEKHQNIIIEPEWVLNTHSTVASVHMAIQAFSEPGDEVILMTPVYHAFARSIAQEERTIVNWPLAKHGQRYDFSLDELKLKISKKSKLLILCSPHNPIGRVWRSDELLAIGEFCLQNGIIIIADELHADLTYSPHEFVALSSINNDIAERCIALQGPGKAFNLTGIGLSSVIIKNSTLRRKFSKIHQQFHPSYGNAFAQVAFAAAYLNGELWLQQLLGYLNDNQKSLQKMLEKHGIYMPLSEATFLAWIDCQKLNMSDVELKSFFVNKARLGLSPGTVFGPGGEQHMRLNFAVPEKIMRKAIDQLDQALQAL